MHVLGILLFVASIIAGPIAFTIAALIGDADFFGLAGFGYMWIIALFAVIPLGSLIFGMIMRKRGGEKSKKYCNWCDCLHIHACNWLIEYGIQNRHNRSFLGKCFSLYWHRLAV